MYLAINVLYITPCCRLALLEWTLWYLAPAVANMCSGEEDGTYREMGQTATLLPQVHADWPLFYFLDWSYQNRFMSSAINAQIP